MYSAFSLITHVARRGGPERASNPRIPDYKACALTILFGRTESFEKYESHHFQASLKIKRNKFKARGLRQAQRVKRARFADFVHSAVLF